MCMGGSLPDSEVQQVPAGVREEEEGSPLPPSHGAKASGRDFTWVTGRRGSKLKSWFTTAKGSPWSKQQVLQRRQAWECAAEGGG